MQSKSVEDRAKKAIALFQGGMTRREAGKKVGIANSSLHTYLKRNRPELILIGNKKKSDTPRTTIARPPKPIITMPLLGTQNIVMTPRDFAHFCKELLNA